MFIVSAKSTPVAPTGNGKAGFWCGGECPARPARLPLRSWQPDLAAQDWPCGPAFRLRPAVLRLRDLAVGDDGALPGPPTHRARNRSPRTWPGRAHGGLLESGAAGLRGMDGAHAFPAVGSFPIPEAPRRLRTWLRRSPRLRTQMGAGDPDVRGLRPHRHAALPLRAGVAPPALKPAQIPSRRVRLLGSDAPNDAAKKSCAAFINREYF